MNSSVLRNDKLIKYEYKKLCSELGCGQETLKILLKNTESYYVKWSEDKIDKKTKLPKHYKDGKIKQRDLAKPLEPLKHIQKRIKANYLESIALPPNVHGSVKRKSNITNSKQHQGNKYLFATDLRDFFPNISSEISYRTLVRLGISNNISHWLTRLMTLEYKIPQGAPTSAHLANLVFLETDLLLIEYCRDKNITYTRYVDDLTFSSQIDFQEHTKEIIDIVSSHGFLINHRKTKYGSRQQVTGVIVYLNKIDAPQTIIDKANEESLSEAKQRPFSNYLNQIRRTNRKKNI